MISIEFKNTEGWKKVITIDFESTVEEALNRFIKKAYGSSNIKLVFFIMHKKLKGMNKGKLEIFLELKIWHG